MSLREPSTHEALDDSARKQLSEFRHRLEAQATSDSHSHSHSHSHNHGGDHSLVLDGESVAVSETVYAAVREVLERFAQGDGVVIGSTDALLTTSQAAQLIGISATYLLRLLDNGTIPVEYRGTHRRIRLADATAYLAQRSSAPS